jgi:hypothetical protein
MLTSSLTEGHARLPHLALTLCMFKGRFANFNWYPGNEYVLAHDRYTIHARHSEVAGILSAGRHEPARSPLSLSRARQSSKSASFPPSRLSRLSRTHTGCSNCSITSVCLEILENMSSFGGAGLGQKIQRPNPYVLSAYRGMLS